MLTRRANNAELQSPQQTVEVDLSDGDVTLKYHLTLGNKGLGMKCRLVKWIEVHKDFINEI